MNEVDDRLAGDPVWELFPYPSSGPGRENVLAHRSKHWLAVIGGVAVAWFLYPPLSVVSACLAVGYRDFVTGQRLARSMPDKAGGKVCSRFSYAWGAWKASWAAFAIVFAVFYLEVVSKGRSDPPPAFVAAILSWIASFALSAAWTASGLLAAYRSEMKVWIGEGLSQARLLLLGMLLAGLALTMFALTSLWIVGKLLRVSDEKSYDIIFIIIFICSFFCCGGVLPLLDWLAPRILADRPGKFGPKVPAVGKWSGH
jgi:hypothetical protein